MEPEGLDPRTRLLAVLAYLAGVILTPDPAILAAELVALATIIVALGYVRPWLRSLRLSLGLAVLVAAVSFFAFDLPTALATGLRLLAAVSSCSLLFRTTAPEDLGNALVKSGVPYAFAFILTTAMQFVPRLSRKLADVRDAQRARGIPLGADWTSLRNYPALLTPMLIGAFSLAEQLAEAMEARGYGAPGRTSVRQYRLRARDYRLAVVIIVAVAVLVTIVRRH